MHPLSLAPFPVAVADTRCDPPDPMEERRPAAETRQTGIGFDKDFLDQFLHDIAIATEVPHLTGNLLLVARNQPGIGPLIASQASRDIGPVCCGIGICHVRNALLPAGILSLLFYNMGVSGKWEVVTSEAQIFGVRNRVYLENRCIFSSAAPVC